MIDSIFKILSAGLSIWESKEKTKYVDQLIDLKRRYYAEYNKPLDQRSDATLDGIGLELRILGDSFCAAAGAKNPAV